MTSRGVNFPDPGFWTKTSIIQLRYGVWVNFTMASLGLAYGFSAVAIPQLESPESSVKVTNSDASWIASIITLFSPIGCILGGYLIDKFGRRTMIVYSHLPLCFGWICTGIATSANGIIIGRVIIGIGIGLAMCSPRIYMTEVCLPNMRGIVGSFPNLAMAVGITLQAGLGSILTWSILCYINAAYAMTLFFCNIRLPETPYFLLKNATIEDAEAALKNFRANGYDFDTEINDLIDFKHDNDICKLTLRQQLAALLKRSTYKPFGIMIVYITLAELSGASIVSMWTIDMLKNSRSSIDAELGNFILGITRIVAGFLGAFILFHIGRRPLSIISGLGAGTAYVTLSFVIKYEHRSMIPQICYMLYVLFSGMCFNTLLPLIMYELYPLQVRGLLGGISISYFNLCIFTSNKCYLYVKDILGFPNMIAAMGTWSIVCAVFLYFCLPETKDLTLQEIEEYYNSRRSTLTSERRIRSMQIISSLNIAGASKSHEKITDRHKKGDSKNVKTSPTVENKNKDT